MHFAQIGDVFRNFGLYGVSYRFAAQNSCRHIGIFSFYLNRVNFAKIVVMKRFLLLLLIVGCISGSNSLASTESEKRILQSVSARQFDGAMAELLKFRAEHEAAFLSKDYDYLLGRMAEANGEFSLALAAFQSVASDEIEAALKTLGDLVKKQL